MPVIVTSNLHDQALSGLLYGQLFCQKTLAIYPLLIVSLFAVLGTEVCDGAGQGVADLTANVPVTGGPVQSVSLKHY